MSETPARLGHCPNCGKPTVKEFRPFCSRRCRDVDLGNWLSGSYVVPGREPAEPLDEENDDDR